MGLQMETSSKWYFYTTSNAIHLLGSSSWQALLSQDSRRGREEGKEGKKQTLANFTHTERRALHI